MGESLTTAVPVFPNFEDKHSGTITDPQLTIASSPPEQGAFHRKSQPSPKQRRRTRKSEPEQAEAIDGAGHPGV